MQMNSKSEFAHHLMPDLTEKTLHTERKYTGKIISVDVLDIELPDGRKAKREVIRHGNAVAILARRPDGKFVFVKQYRKAAEEALIGVLRGSEITDRVATDRVIVAFGLERGDCQRHFGSDRSVWRGGNWNGFVRIALAGLLDSMCESAAGEGLLECRLVFCADFRPPWPFRSTDQVTSVYRPGPTRSTDSASSVDRLGHFGGPTAAIR